MDATATQVTSALPSNRFSKVRYQQLGIRFDFQQFSYARFDCVGVFSLGLVFCCSAFNFCVDRDAGHARHFRKSRHCAA